MAADPAAASSATGGRSGGLLRSSAIVALMTLCSRILGLARDVTMATLFGISGATDAFFVAFKVPNLFRRLFAEGAFSQGFVPVLGQWRREHPDAVPELVAHTAGLLLVVLCLLVLLLVVAAPWVVALFAPGFVGDADKWALAAGMLRLTAPYVLCISLCALAAGVLNTFGRFIVPAFSPVLLNICLISACFIGVQPALAARVNPLEVLAGGVFVAGFAQLALHLWALSRLGMLSRPRLSLQHPGVTRILGKMGPAVFGASVAQINLLVDTLLASLLLTGSISWLFYADRMIQLPLGVFGVGLATVVLPRLSQLAGPADDDVRAGAWAGSAAADGFRDTLALAVRLVVLVAVPAAAALFVLATPVLATVYGYGAMRPLDLSMTVLAMQALALGLPGFMLVKVLAAAWFAMQDTRTPVRVGLVALGVNLFVNLCLFVPLGHVGLAFGTALASLYNAWTLARGLAGRGLLVDVRRWGVFLARVGLAAGGMVLFLQQFPLGPDAWIDAPLTQRLGRLALAVIGGFLVYAATLLLLGLRRSALRVG